MLVKGCTRSINELGQKKEVSLFSGRVPGHRFGIQVINEVRFFSILLRPQNVANYGQNKRVGITRNGHEIASTLTVLTLSKRLIQNVKT